MCRRISRIEAPETWKQEYIDECNEIWEAVDHAADYLRQLAWMIVSKRESKSRELEVTGKIQATYLSELAADDPRRISHTGFGIALWPGCVGF
jgi:hypothetical protein